MPTPRFCFYCHESVPPRLQLCGFCKALWYCGAVCQRRDWPRHKHECVSRELRRQLHRLPEPLMRRVREFVAKGPCSVRRAPSPDEASRVNKRTYDQVKDDVQHFVVDEAQYCSKIELD